MNGSLISDSARIPDRLSDRRSVLKGLAGLATLVMGGSLTACGSDGEAKSYTVKMVEMAFDPIEITVPVGSTVTWENVSEFVHTVTTDPSVLQDPNNVSSPEPSVFNSGNLTKGESWSHTFNTPGEVRYCCQPHELVGMFGRVVVED